MVSTYTVLVAYRSTWWDRLWRLRPSRTVKVWPLCPVCANPVTAWTPQIRQGDEFYNSRSPALSWKKPDELVGFLLRPCGHGVEHVAMMKATTA